MKNLIRAFVFTALSVFAIAQAQVALQPVTSFGTNGDGLVRPNDVYFLTSSNQWQRGMAYNPTTGHLLVVDRSTNTATGINNDVYILDGNTGLAVTNFDGSPRKLDNSSTLPGGNTAFVLNLIGIADDGSIYVVNLSSASFPPQVHLYRWENEGAAQTFVYNGDPSNGTSPNTAGPRRWGDTMAIRGSGINTQILLGNRGTKVALLAPTDPSLTSFTATTLTTDAPVGGFSVGLSFGTGNTFWGTSGGFNNGPLLHMQFDTGAGTATTLKSFPPTVFPGTISPLLIIPSSNLLAGITMVGGADVVRLYNISNPDSPVLLDRKSFATTNSNGNFAGALALGTNGVLYALDSDNGILALALTSSAPGPLGPAFFLSPATQLAVAGNSVTLTSGADGDAPISYQWQLGGTNIANATNATFSITNVQLSDAGSYTVIASNAVTNATSAAGILTVAATPPTSLLIYDPIPYAPGSFITGQGGWLSPAGQESTFKADAGNLDVPGLAASQSNRITWPLTPASSIRISNGVTTASGPIYASFAYRIDNLGSLPAGGAGSTVAAFVPNFTAATYSTKIDVRKDVGGVGYNIGAWKTGGEVVGAWAPNVFSLGETVFLVARYIFGESGTTAAGDDACALWLNPDPSSFGSTNIPNPTIADFGIGSADTLSQIVGFALRTSGGPSLSYADEIRVGLTWADVTPPVAGAAPRLVVTLNGSAAEISWPASATGFNLEGAGNLTSPITWTPVTNSVVLSGTNNTISISATTGNQYFRLRK